MFWWILLLPVAAFVAVILIRTIRFRPAVEEPAPELPAPIDAQHAADSLSAMIRCRTVS